MRAAGVIIEAETDEGSVFFYKPNQVTLAPIRWRMYTGLREPVDACVALPNGEMRS